MASARAATAATSGWVEAAPPTTSQAACHRSTVGSATTAAATPDRTASARSPRAGSTYPDGSASSTSGSIRSHSAVQVRNSMAGPSPTLPTTKEALVSLDAPAAPAAAHRRAAWSQERGLGHASPAAPASGTASSRLGRAEMKAASSPRAAGSPTSHPGGSVGRCGAGQPPMRPRAKPAASAVQVRWQNRLASGAAKSQPSAACSGGLAAATMRTSSGRVRSPTVRSSTTRSRAAWTAGGAVVSSSRKSSPDPTSASRRAQAGGASETPPSVTTGRPEKSVGSWMEATTTSKWRAQSSARARTTEVLPEPGGPHRMVGVPMAAAMASASVVVSLVLMVLGVLS